MVQTADPVVPAPDRREVEVVAVVVDSETDSWVFGSVVAELAHASFAPHVVAPTSETAITGLGQQDLTRAQASDFAALVLLAVPSDENGDIDERIVHLVRAAYERPCALLALREVADPFDAVGIGGDDEGVEVLDEVAQIVPRLAHLLPLRTRWAPRRRPAR